jgi:ABC-type hemin transport system substrate-binding protein
MERRRDRTAGTPKRHHHEDVRVVSLVPSATETLRALGITPVACTRFCEQPDLPTVGGTKDPHVDEIVTLAPDLVVVNDEENRREDADALSVAGLALHSMSPRSLADVGPAVRALADAVGIPVPAPFGAGEWPPWLAGSGAQRRGRVAVLVWRRPWMTMRADTYGSSLLAHLGWANVVPAAGDRYPETTLGELAARGPDLVLLPTEPYPFGERHVPEVAAGFRAARITLVDGRDLYWWGIRTPAAVERLRDSLVVDLLDDPGRDEA